MRRKVRGNGKEESGYRIIIEKQKYSKIQAYELTWIFNIHSGSHAWRFHTWCWCSMFIVHFSSMAKLAHKFTARQPPTQQRMHEQKLFKVKWMETQWREREYINLHCVRFSFSHTPATLSAEKIERRNRRKKNWCRMKPPHAADSWKCAIFIIIFLPNDGNR